MIAVEERQIKIALMGPSGAGKSHTLRVLSGKEGIAHKTVGAEVTNHHLTTSSGDAVKVNLWDCAGTKTYERLVAIHIQRSDSILVFYSPYKAESFEQAKGWLQLISERSYPQNKVWVVRCLRNDEDYKAQEEGRTYFINAGYKHVDLSNFSKEEIERLIKEVVESIPAPPKKVKEIPEHFEGIRFGDIVFDNEWLGKYIDLLHEDEKAAKAKEDEHKF